MKQKDIVLMVAVSIFSAVISLLLSNVFLSSPEALQTTVEDVPQITAEFPEPDKRYFNLDALNPTRLIDIGDSTNTNPFQETSEQQ